MFERFIARQAILKDNLSELFLMGLLSTADALLGRPMAQVLRELSLSGEIRAALNGGGRSFDELHATLRAYEKGD